jgi:hypothetical protein
MQLDDVLLGAGVAPCRSELHSPYLHGNPNPLRGQPPQDPLAEIVLDEELVGERLHVAQEREI